MRLHLDVQKTGLEAKLQHRSKVHPGDGAKGRAGCKLQRTYEGSFQETRYLQPMSVQAVGPEAGLQAGTPTAKFRQRAKAQAQA